MFFLILFVDLLPMPLYFLKKIYNNLLKFLNKKYLNMFQIKEIKKDNFNEAFELANKGFNMNSNKSKELYNFIFQSNLSINFFGYGLYLNKNLAGVLFTPIQGYIQKKPGVSLICFFVIPSCRGVRAIQFLNNTTNLMKDKFAFVTNYTPSKAVINISRKLG